MSWKDWTRGVLSRLASRTAEAAAAKQPPIPEPELRWRRLCAVDVPESIPAPGEAGDLILFPTGQVVPLKQLRLIVNRSGSRELLWLLLLPPKLPGLEAYYEVLAN